MQNQIYFIDTKLEDYQVIINSLSSTDKYYLIDSSSDGLTQISNILSNYSNLDSIHVYSHGDVGSLNIGNTIYDNTNISNYKIELEDIGKSLTTTGDILVYGCNVGQGEIGLNFVNQIAQYTNVDVAASDDLTGNKVLGGDWDLEIASGVIETKTFEVKDYQSVMVDDHSNTTINATALTLGSVTNGNIEINGDIDYFEVNLIAGEKYLFEMKETNIYISPYLSLYDNLGLNIQSIMGTSEATFIYSTNKTGNYYLSAKNYLYNSKDVTYTVKYSLVSDDYPDFKEYASSMSLEDIKNGNIEVSGDIDYFKIDLIAGKKYLFELNHITLGLNTIELYYNNGNSINSFTNGLDKSQFSFIATTSGIHYLSVYSNSTGMYTIKGSILNEFTPTITSISIGTIAENAVNTTVIYKVEATDSDGTTPTYSLSGTDASLLNINSTTGDVTLKSSADYETKNSYYFNVIASDGNLFDTKAITVNVNNVNEEIVPMKINFNYNSNLKLDNIENILDSSEDLSDIDIVQYGNLTTHTSTQMIYKYYTNGNYYTETFIGSNLKPTTLPTTSTITKMITKNDTTGQVSTMEGNFKYNLDSNGNETLTSAYFSKITEIIPYNNGKFLTATISADKINVNENSEATSDMKNFKYIISDGVGGNVTFSTALLKASDFNNLVNGDLTLKQGIEYFSNSRFLSLDDNISIAKSTELFLNKNGKPELNGYGGNDTFTGSKLSDILNGGAGADTLKGGLGNDTYVVDNVKDVVTELASQGTDTIKSSVTYTLSSNVENLTLIGSSAINGNGNTLNNTITGNSAANTLNGLAGNDTLNGGAGADKMLGSSGNDTYYVDNIGDKVYETKTTVSTSGDAGGIDKVNSSISYTLTSYVENLTLTGTKAINGTGNNLNNTLIGNAVANKLSGAAGNDILNGGAGNDVINGGAGNDVINGGLGNDTLIGGLGKDTFVFNTAMNSTTNVDKIKDFSVVDDLINLENSIFTKLTTIGTLKTANFKANIDGLAKDVNDYLVYETDTGKLFYDADGSGVGKAVQIALIENKAALTYADFTVI